MTNLQIHIETSVHCRECGEIIEFFLNGSYSDLFQKHDLYGVASFVTKASQFFVQQGWRQQMDGSWLCQRHNSTAADGGSSDDSQALRRAA